MPRRALVARTTGLAIVLAGGVLAAVLARGGGSASSAGGSGPVTTVAKRAAPVSFVAGCPRAKYSLARPRDFPDAFPLPHGTVITNIERSRTGTPRLLYLIGYAPLRFAELVAFFRNVPARQGFQLTGGEVETADAETKFVGHGLRGATRIAVLTGCTRATWLLVAVTLRQQA